MNLISFVDIDSQDYIPENFLGITYRDAMRRIYGISKTGEILSGVAVFREAYKLIGVGWIYQPTGWPLLKPFVDFIYEIWARSRLALTGRPSLHYLCQKKDLD